MAWAYSVNNLPLTGAEAWVAFITLLTTGPPAGQRWILPQWSDATTVFTTGAPAAADLKHQFAWFRLQSPADPTTGAHREIVIQSNSVGSPYKVWGLKYSASAGFTTAGLLPAKDVPTSTDEVSWPHGGGILGNSSHTTTTASYFLPNDGGYRVHMAAGGTTENYSFYFLTVATGGTTIIQGMMLDIPTPWGGASALDSAIVYDEYSSSAFAYTSHLSSYSYGHAGYISASTTAVASYSFIQATPSVPYIQGCPANSWSGNTPIMAPVWFSYGYAVDASGRGNGVRGVSPTLLYDMRINSAPYLPVNMDLFTVSNTGDHIWVNASLLPWPSGTAVLS